MIGESKDLKQYVHDMNFHSLLMGNDMIKFPISESDAIKIAGKLSVNLSPENLNCDGEISVEEAQDTYDYYMRVWRQLTRQQPNLDLPES